MKKNTFNLRTSPLANSNILRINSEREEIWVNPPYQRNGEVWPEDKRQLLIDSILNEFDIPKMYFHILGRNSPGALGRTYAVIDGRQRLETIWKFIDGGFSLAKDFEYFRDETVKAASLTYSQMALKYPKLKTIFDSFTLPIVCVETNDLDIIDDMFTRLNEGAPLNAAEKRNAIGGPMTTSINKVASQKFFTECVKFSNKRYQHREVAARLLFIVASQKNNQEIVDTKKAFLDAFVKSMKKQPKLSKEYEEAVASVLKKMHSAFHKQDPLLRSQSNVPIYFLLFDDMRKQGGKTVKREILSRFAGAVASNRETAEKDLSSADPALLEFERLSIQGTNDASSIKRRFEILKKYVSFHQSSNKKKEGSLQLTHK